MRGHHVSHCPLLETSLYSSIPRADATVRAVCPECKTATAISTPNGGRVSGALPLVLTLPSRLGHRFRGYAHYISTNLQRVTDVADDVAPVHSDGRVKPPVFPTVRWCWRRADDEGVLARLLTLDEGS